MSVRRLAEEQPASFAFTPANDDWCQAQIAKYPPGRQASAVIPLLWQAQKQNDYWLPKPAIEKVADMLDMPYIRVLEIATFYTMFNLSPVGKFYIQFCGTTPCVLAGADGIKTVLEKRIGPQSKVSADGAFSWLEVECLGACCNAPMVQINDDYYEDLTPDNFNTLLDDLAAGRKVKVGPQSERVGSEPAGGLTSLTSFYGADGRSPPQQPESGPYEQDHDAARAEKAGQDGIETEPATARAQTDREQRVGKPAGSITDTGDRRTKPSTSKAGKAADAKQGASAQQALGGAQQGQPSSSPGVEPEKK